MQRLRDVIAAMSAAAKENLVNAGFRKRTGDIFTVELKGDVLGWVGLNRATYNNQGPLDVNPVVGVRDQAVERILAELLNERFHPYIPPTTSIPLGYVMPAQTYLTWTFETLESLPGQAKNMTDAILTYGLTYMLETSSRSALVGTMRRKPASVQYSYRLPIALWLEGSGDEASDVIDQRLNLIGLPFSDAVQRYWRFAEALRRRMSESALAR